MHSLAFFGKHMHSLALKKHHLGKNQNGHPTKSQDTDCMHKCDTTEPTNNANGCWENQN
jgi:hypothetical protein